MLWRKSPAAEQLSASVEGGNRARLELRCRVAIATLLKNDSRRAKASAVIVRDQNAVRLRGAIGTTVQKHAAVDGQ